MRRSRFSIEEIVQIFKEGDLSESSVSSENLISLLIADNFSTISNRGRISILIILLLTAELIRNLPIFL